jgi:hypothetical protein
LREIWDNREAESQKPPPFKEVIKGDEKRLKDLIEKMERRYDLLFDAVQ